MIFTASISKASSGSDAGRVVAINATITDTRASGSFVKQYSMPIKFHLEEESYKKLLAVLDEGVV